MLTQAVRENSQNDFRTGSVLCVCMCVCVFLHKNVSQILATMNSSRGEIARKTLSVMKISQVTCDVFRFLELASSNLA